MISFVTVGCKVTTELFTDSFLAKSTTHVCSLTAESSVFRSVKVEDSEEAPSLILGTISYRAVYRSSRLQ